MKKLIALLLAVLMCLSLCACGEDSESGETQAPNTSDHSSTTAPTAGQTDGAVETTAPVTQPTTQPGLALSDDLADFTVSIEGVVYQLPCGVDQLLNNGWSEGREYTYEVKAGDTVTMELYLNDTNKSIGVEVFNPGTETRTYNECIIRQIKESTFGGDCEVLIAGGFDVHAADTYQTVTGALGGEENEHYNNSTSYGLYYQYENGHYLFQNLDESAHTWAIIIEWGALRAFES